MTFEHSVSEDATLGVTMTNSPKGLSAIHRPDCMAAIWRREPTAAFQNWIETLPPSTLPQARVILRPQAVRQAATEVIADAGLSEADEAAILADDVAALAMIFAELMEAPYLRLRIDAISGDACRRFHMDAITARLICTYRGPGTEYGLATVAGDPLQVFAAPTGAPMVLCGSEWPGGTPEPRLLHRSPQIATTDRTRVVLVLDPVSLADVDV